MRKSKKIIVFTVILVLIIIAVISAIIIINQKRKNATGTDKGEQGLTLYDTNLSEYVKETENGIKVNTSIQLNQDKKIGELTVSGIQLTCKSGITTLIATVTNNTTTNTNLQNIEVAFLDKNGQEFATAKGIVEALEVGKSTKLNISMSANYINTYDITFRVK